MLDKNKKINKVKKKRLTKEFDFILSSWPFCSKLEK
jgi:hypothetical protein